MSRIPNLAIVGAGMSGLCTAAKLTAIRKVIDSAGKSLHRSDDAE